MTWLVAVPAFAAGTWAPARKLDSYLDALDSRQLVSLTVAVSEKGKLRYQRSIGFATIEGGRPHPADEATRYRAGPVSSLFTAVLFMQRVETASITLDHPLAEFFPDVAHATTLTYRDLLQHQSGLTSYLRAPDSGSWRLQPRSRAELLERILAGGSVFAPRERIEYSDTNPLLLGLVLEKLTDRSYDELVERQILEKLGLFRTYFAGTGNDSLESRSYRYTDSGWVALPLTDPTAAGGAYGMVSTPAELTRFIDAVFSGHLVSAHSLQSLRGTRDDPAMGLWPYTIAGETGYGQSGGADGFAAGVYHFPARGISIACMFNASRIPMSEVFDQVLTTILDRGHTPPTPVALPATPAE